ncbi:hypothetical protein HOT45_gp44 [Gordonia phage Trine]|uniref:Uncharacterized protein n=1 Tax=Gordonia phage Trine TaxID=2201431 RepID=A0A2Z4Q9H9_9CAUD|nr:hypothetical protein HOT45_gp44 [Gordonia phage Trine]AWY06545.1 hypothetical protein PBI_TRINE_44 [Gordonia phage Trine]
MGMSQGPTLPLPAKHHEEIGRTPDMNRTNPTATERLDAIATMISEPVKELADLTWELDRHADPELIEELRNGVAELLDALYHTELADDVLPDTPIRGQAHTFADVAREAGDR